MNKFVIYLGLLLKLGQHNQGGYNGESKEFIKSFSDDNSRQNCNGYKIQVKWTYIIWTIWDMKLAEGIPQRQV